MAFARWANHALRIKLYYRVVTVDNAPEIDKGSNKGRFQKRFSGFFPLRGYPPLPYPLNGKSFCQNTLSGKGGYPPPLNGQNPLKRF